ALAADRRAVAGMIDLGLTNGGLVAGGRIVDWLRGLGIRGPIEAMARPFAAVATDLVSGHEVWLRRGDLAGAIRASIAMPGIFCPVQVERRWLVDGGLVNPVPVSV